jgi:hypothetical protein
VRFGGRETKPEAQGLAIWAHAQGWHARVCPIRDYYAGDLDDPSVFATARDLFVTNR